MCGGQESTIKSPILAQYSVLTAEQEGILEARKSALAHVLLGDFFLSLEEYESAVECTRKGLKLAAVEGKKTDLSFQRYVMNKKTGVQTTMLIWLVHAMP